jgi:succinate dehydrogenase/fumarate reductase flavoprotein subunit
MPVIGAIAGKNAARRALSKLNIPLALDQVDAVKNRLESVIKRDEGFDPLEVRADLSDVMSLNVGVIRNEDGLRKAAEGIENIKKDKLDRLCVVDERSFKALARLFEVENLVMIG